MSRFDGEVVSVSELIERARTALDHAVGMIAVEGEVFEFGATAGEAGCGAKGASPVAFGQFCKCRIAAIDGFADQFAIFVVGHSLCLVNVVGIGKAKQRKAKAKISKAKQSTSRAKKSKIKQSKTKQTKAKQSKAKQS